MTDVDVGSDAAAIGDDEFDDDEEQRKQKGLAATKQIDGADRWLGSLR